MRNPTQIADLHPSKLERTLAHGMARLASDAVDAVVRGDVVGWGLSVDLGGRHERGEVAGFGILARLKGVCASLGGLDQLGLLCGWRLFMGGE